MGIFKKNAGQPSSQEKCIACLVPVGAGSSLCGRCQAKEDQGRADLKRMETDEDFRKFVRGH